MSALSRLVRKSNLTDDDIKRIAEAVAGHATEATATAPQSPRVAALLRQVQTPMPVPERPSAPAPVPATPPVIRTRISPASIHQDRPDRLVTDCGPGIPPLTSVLQYGADGRIAGVALGTATFKIHRGQDGRISAITSGDYVSRIKRDAAGKMLEFTATGIPPCWWK